MKKKRIKQEFVDDGRTLYDMSGVGSPEQMKRGMDDSKKEKIHLTRSERWQVIKAALATYMPLALGIILCFSLTMVLISLWLN